MNAKNAAPAKAVVSAEDAPPPAPEAPQRGGSARPDATAGLNPFVLEDLFPDPVDLFQPSLVPTADAADVIVAIDTNALLLPYVIGKDDLGALASAYRTLAREKRLFLPARSAREFIKHRDRKIGEFLQAASDQSSKISVKGVVAPILEGMEGYRELKAAGANLEKERKAYLDALRTIRAGVSAWRGDDPVTALYAEVFTAENVVEHEEQREVVQRDWARRCAEKIPPGYKDGGKPDGGVGDYLIWLSMLRIGREQRKHLIFVTGEEKADWFVRSGGDAVFPRPELLIEYRAASGGKSLQLSSLSEVLEQFGAETSVVSEVRAAEETANSAVRSSASARTKNFHLLGQGGTGSLVEFDYSQNDGRVTVPSPGGGFDLRFSKASDLRIHLSRTPGVIAVMRLKGVMTDSLFDIQDYDGSSSTYTVESGEAFAALNQAGEVLVGRILAIADDTRGSTGDWVVFKFRVFPPGGTLLAP